jgi:LmbE family N-acetylglucosaminyl deacetylase
MSTSKFQRPLRLAGLVLGAALVVACAAALAVQFGIHLTNEWQQYSPVKQVNAPARDSRIIVFAPHSDDETLGCGGLLALAARNGARIRVVLVTNGDGFRLGVARAYGSIRVTPARCVDFAYRRQRETMEALKTLGVRPADITFLGYPDRGIAPLWDTHWTLDELYTSHATRTNHSPYSNSYRPGAPYCGEALLADVQRIVRSERPTDIYLPHPCDNHSDHFATYCFVTAAVEQLRSEGFPPAARIRLHTYLVHRGDWPTPKGDYPRERLSPPFALAKGSTRWHSLALPDDVSALKRAAIRKYRTQTAIERGFLTSFARSNELFGTILIGRVARIRSNSVSVDGAPEDWWGIPPAVVDPVGDYVVAGVNKGGDVRSIYLCRDDRRLYVRLDCVGRISKRLRYTISLRGVSESDLDDAYSVSIKPPSRCSRSDARWAYRGHTLEVSVPFTAFRPDDNLFVKVETRLVKLTVDNTGWHGLEVGTETAPKALDTTPSSSSRPPS